MFKSLKPKFASMLAAGIFVGKIKNACTINLVPKSEVPWSDVTKQHQFTIEAPEGKINHWFHDKGYVSQKDYDKSGILEGKAVPAGMVFLSSEGYDEQYLCKKNADGTYTRRVHDLSKITVDGVTKVMVDSEIDKLIENGKDVTFESESKSRTGMRMMSEFANHAGIPEGESWDFTTIDGLEIGIKVEETGRTNKDGNDTFKITRFMSADYATKQIALLEE